MGELLLTKLHVPRRRQGLVTRPRLRERLSRGADSALMLVSAPAGFGKTTMLTDWLAAASAEQLSDIPGIGGKTAGKILAAARGESEPATTEEPAETQQ